MDYFIALTLLLTPTYALRFDLFGFPANLLMVWVVFFWLIFFIYLILKKQLSMFLTAVKNTDKKNLLFITVFFLAGLVSLLVNGFDQKKIGQFVVLFLQPISLFFIAGFIIKQKPSAKSLLLTSCYLLLAVMGIYAVLQYFALLGLPPMWQGNSVEPKRAIAFWSHPNFYALFSAPLLAFLVPDVFQNLKSKILNLKSIAWAIGAIGLLLSLSRAGWLGLGIAGLVYLLIAADKKIRGIIFATVIVIVIIIVSVPNLRWRFVLPFYGEKSAVSRLSLWNTGVKAIKEAPILGLGLTGFAKNWDRLNTDPNLDSHNFPHNIFLDLWMETGIIGLISLIGLMGLIIFRGLHPFVIPAATTGGPESISGSRIRVRDDTIKLGLALFLIALITQGLIDNPYFKNDLAMVFWIILSLGL